MSYPSILPPVNILTQNNIYTAQSAVPNPNVLFNSALLSSPASVKSPSASNNSFYVHSLAGLIQNILTTQSKANLSQAKLQSNLNKLNRLLILTPELPKIPAKLNLFDNYLAKQLTQPKQVFYGSNRSQIITKISSSSIQYADGSNNKGAQAVENSSVVANEGEIILPAVSNADPPADTLLLDGYGYSLPQAIIGSQRVDERSLQSLYSFANLLISLYSSQAFKQNSMKNNGIQNNNQNLVEVLLPILLKYYVSLPWIRFESAQQGTNAAKQLTGLLLALANHDSRISAHIYTAVQLLMRVLTLIYCNGPYKLASEPAEKLLQHNSAHILTGILHVLASNEHTSELTLFTAQDLHAIVSALLNCTEKTAPSIYCYSIKALAVIIWVKPSLLEQEQAKSLYDKLFSGLIYSKPLQMKRPVNELDRNQQILVDTMENIIYLAVIITQTRPEYTDSTFNKLKELLNACLANGLDENQVKRVNLGCAQLANIILRALCALNQSNGSLLQPSIDYLRSALLNSKRLLLHAEGAELRRLLSFGVAKLFSQELAAVNFSNSMARSTVQSLLPLVYNDRSEEQRAVTLLITILVQIKHSELIELICPVILQKFNGRSANSTALLGNIMQPLVELACIVLPQHNKSQQLFESVVNLLIQAYSAPQNANPSGMPLSYSSNSLSALQIDQLTASLPASMSSGDLTKLRSASELQHNVAEQPQNRRKMVEIPPALYNLAVSQQNTAIKANFLKRLIRLFVELGIAINESHSAREKSQVCAALLPTIAVLISTIAQDSTEPLNSQLFHSQSSNIKWFRRFWFLLVQLNLHNSPSNELHQAIGTIAKFSPVLLTANKFNYLATELELELKHLNIGPEAVEPLRKQLNSLIPEKSNEIYYLPPAKLLFVLSIYHLELLRVKHHNSVGLKAIFHYIGDEDLKQTNLLGLIEALAQQIFHWQLENSTGFTEEDVNFLLKKLCSRYESERNSALGFIKKLAAHYPHFQWSKLCLCTLLTLVHAISITTDSNIALNQPRSHIQQLPSSSAEILQIDFPQSLATRNNIYERLTALAENWLVNSKYLVPNELNNVLNEYMLELQRIDRLKYIDWGLKGNEPNTIHMRLHTSTNITNMLNTQHKGLMLAIKVNQLNNLPIFISALSVKELHIGEIRGLYHAHAHFKAQYSNGASSSYRNHGLSSDDSLFSLNNRAIVNWLDEGKQSFPNMLAKHLSNEANAILNDFRRICLQAHKYNLYPSPGEEAPSGSQNSSFKGDFDESIRLLHVRYETCIYQTTALLIWFNSEYKALAIHQHNELNSYDLIHLLCKLPGQIFTSQAISIASFAWDWLLSANEQFLLPLLVEMRAAWNYTIDRQIGLFAHERTVNSKLKVISLSAGGPLKSIGKPEPMLRDITGAQLIPTPVQIDIANNEIINDAKGMNHENKDDLQTKSAAAAAWNDPLDVPYSHIEIDILSESEREAHQRESIMPHSIWISYLAQKFNYLHSYPPKCVEMINLMLCKAFLNPKRLSTDPAAFIPRIKLLQLAGNIISYYSARSSIDNQITVETLRSSFYLSGLKWFNSSPIWINVDDVQRNSLAQFRQDAQSLIELLKYLQKDSYSANKLLQKQRELLLFLLCDELERITVWLNPQRLEELKFPDENLFSTQRNIGEKEWKSYLAAAWAVEPRLAVRFAQRFHYNEIIQLELQELVRRNPSEVYDLGDAVSFLVTPSAVRENIPQLSSLIYFHPTSLAQALLFFTEPYYQHRLVVEYAVNTLRSHPVAHVLFYLSQILQSLRHDQFGLIQEFLIQSSSTSILLSHQLIWLCQAELGEVHATGKPLQLTPFRLVVQRVVDKIIGNFSPAAKKFFEEEFNFFEQITAISGILKPIATKPGRKAKIRSELEKIAVKPNIYLPTNPNLQVQEIICKSGTPMQSAAKVPILVAFKVKHQPIDEQQIINDLASNNTKNQQQLALPATPAATAANNASAGAGGANSGEESNVSYFTTSTLEESNTSQNSDTEEHSELNVNNENKELAAPNNRGKVNAAKQSKRGGANNGNNNGGNSSVAAVFPQACIFKVGDDCRQDALALQIIQWCKNIFKLYNLELFVYPYRVLPNRTGEEGLIGGIIECVPNAQTRDELGKSVATSLKNYFLSRYGREESAAFQAAQRNFITSLAGYALVSYILQAKDRHNGNLMIDQDGRLIHIDFGFIFDISPAKDMKFESAAFKLTLEMVEIMGGSPSSPLYKWFVDLVIRGFLCIREHQQEILSLVEPMLISSLKCFKPNSLHNLKQRFFPQASQRQAADMMVEIINDAYNKFTTNVYDMIQKAQQNVYYYQKEE
jgi:hypothetical protein